MSCLQLFLLAFIQAVLVLELHIVKADFSDNCVNSNNSTSCIHTYEQLYNSLAKSENSFNIESALYPAKKLSSVRVFVNVYGPNKTKNSKPVGKYTWSISCLYAAIPVHALEVLSLGSILVTPRTQTLNIQIPLFCCNVSGNGDERRTRIKEMIEGVLAALQDLAVSPGIRDPTLNTAECVIEGHETDIDATGRNIHIRIIVWSSFACAFFSCFLLSSFLEVFWKPTGWPVNTDNKKDENASVQGKVAKISIKKYTAKAVCILCFVLAFIGSCILITASALSIHFRGNSFPEIALAPLFLMLEIFFYSLWRYKRLLEIGKYSFFLSICATVTSYISCWLLIGIMINPAWGLTVALLVSFLCAAFMYVVHEYLNCENDYKGQTAFLCVCSIAVVIVLGTVVVSAGQSYNGRETADETLKTVLLYVIGLLVSWVSWKRYSSEKKTSNGTSAANTDQSPNQQTSNGTSAASTGENIEMQPLLNSPN